MIPSTKLRITAFQLAESVNIKKFKAEYTGNIIAASPQELFYLEVEEQENSPSQNYLYVLNYGVVVFAGYDDVRMSVLLQLLRGYCSNVLATSLREEFDIHHPSQELVFGYNEIFVPSFNSDVLRIVMLNVGQSVALDYYDALTDELLKEPNAFTRELELYGRLRQPRKRLLQYIGKTLNVKNRIIDNLYIMDEPDITWENEYLAKINKGLKNTFDIRNRFRFLDMMLQEIKNNLEMFSNVLQHRESNRLEWIIIILIFIEVIHLFAAEIF